jgi:hydroxymethylpyrimidine pyrophosphatase-like HAD family hydrolase
MTPDLKQTIKVNSFPKQVLDAVRPLNVLMEEKIIGITLTTNRGIISDKNNQDFLKFIKEFGFIPERVDSSFSLSDDEFPISLMYWTKPNEENGIKKMVGKAVRNRASVVTSRECVFVTAKIANKAVGIKQALAGTEMSLSENVVTIGDSNNDIEMLKGARYGFAMGNCTPLACQAADAIIGSNDSDAIAQLIEKIMISGGCSY